jgi:hypothetical protein
VSPCHRKQATQVEPSIEDKRVDYSLKGAQGLAFRVYVLFSVDVYLETVDLGIWPVLGIHLSDKPTICPSGSDA